MEKNEIVEEIVNIEWYFFKNTKNTDGIAECQLNDEEFFIMRKGQWLCYPLKVLQSYLQDLYQALDENRNLVFEKYLYMMKNTEPLEYEKLKNILKVYETRAHEVLRNDITKIYMEMAKDFYNKYPNFSNNCRPLYKKDDELERASLETYLMGELYTYSPKTLMFLLDYIKELKQENKNIVYIVNSKVIELKNMNSIEIVEQYLNEI